MDWNDYLAQLGQQIVAAADQRGISLRLCGGAGVWLRCQPRHALLRRLGRRINDLDFVASHGDQGAVRDMLAKEFGLEADAALDAVPEIRRSIHRRKAAAETPAVSCDVNYGGLNYCHEIDLSRRLTIDPETITLSDLLLSKLQIRELSRRDVMDALALLLSYPCTKDHDAGLNVQRIAQLCGRDFGLWQTAMSNFQRLQDQLPELCRDLTADELNLARDRLVKLQNACRDEAKSWRWRFSQALAHLWPAIRWHQLVDEQAQDGEGTQP